MSWGLQQKAARKQGDFFSFSPKTLPQGCVESIKTLTRYNPWESKLPLQGYKEFTVHMSSFHGGLDMVMAMDAREEVEFLCCLDRQ